MSHGKRIEGSAALESEIQRAAGEYLERTRGVTGCGKPGWTPRKALPRLRGAPAEAAIIEGRR